MDITGSAANLTWTGATSTAWDHETLNNWTGANPNKFYDNDFVTFDDTAVNPNVSINENVLPGFVTFNNSVAYAISGTGSINGFTGLAKNGSGTVVLANSNGNQYTGATAINAGLLVLGNANAVQNSTVSVNAANGLGFAPGIGTFNLGALNGSGHWPCRTRRAPQ